ncbi:hypothetical protein ACFFJT_05395 [Dyella flava]|uniref:Uncharacterized protein n=1 Tax=Dyella flava TaxID=1920170 RepID=A0ABS2K6J7_9GAMM|nr:hypothetical protein [Dyella flava]MBM7126789.1 hypothetical protein [Dyella flava]GLQ49386.1 hypothetical protein GCM10010872_08350 [Dyella flava]
MIADKKSPFEVDAKASSDRQKDAENMEISVRNTLATLHELEQMQRKAATEAISVAAARRHEELILGIAVARQIVIGLKRRASP